MTTIFHINLKLQYIKASRTVPAWREQHAPAAHMSRADRRSPAARAPAPRRALLPTTRHPLLTNDAILIQLNHFNIIIVIVNSYEQNKIYNNF